MTARPSLEAHARSPRATNIILLGTLIVTIVAVARMLTGSLTPGEAAGYLSLFTVLFLLRVLGQILVVLRAPRWLPRAEGENWNLVPYRILLPAQIGIFALMCTIIAGVWRGTAPFGAQHAAFGQVLIALSLVYAGIMALRYVVRMTRRPAERWFGGAIPIVFHMVLAAFVLTWGRYHVSG